MLLLTLCASPLRAPDRLVVAAALSPHAGPVRARLRQRALLLLAGAAARLRPRRLARRAGAPPLHRAGLPGMAAAAAVGRHLQPRRGAPPGRALAHAAPRRLPGGRAGPGASVVAVAGRRAAPALHRAVRRADGAAPAAAQALRRADGAAPAAAQALRPPAARRDLAARRPVEPPAAYGARLGCGRMRMRIRIRRLSPPGAAGPGGAGAARSCKKGLRAIACPGAVRHFAVWSFSTARRMGARSRSLLPR